MSTDPPLRAVIAAVVAAALAIAIAISVSDGGDDGDVEVELADETATTEGGDDEEPTSTTTPSTTTPEDTTISTATSTTVSETTTTTASTTTAPPRPPTTTTAPPPRAATSCASADSTDPDGLDVQVCLERGGVAGEPAVIRITASDRDARVRDDCGSPVVEWGDEPVVVCAIGCEPSSVPQEPSSIDITREHTYAEPGSYDVKVTVESDCGQGPYGETQQATLQLTIR